MPLSLTSTNKLSATVHDKLPQHWKVHNIVQYLKEITCNNMEMTSFASEELFFLGGGGQIGAHRKIRTAFSQTQEFIIRK